jgi:hypothetical protein
MHFSPNAPATRDLLARLIEETERACAPEASTDVDAFDQMLVRRGELLDALERSVHALFDASRTGGRAMPHPDRRALLELAKELERANGRLAHGVRIERDLVGAAIAAVDRPDAIASSYNAVTPTELPHLDLRR